MTLISSANDILTWLKLATDTVTGGMSVRERYRMDTSAWVVLYRPDCNMETAYAYLNAYKYSGDSTYLDMSRSIYDYISTYQRSDGSWAFSINGSDTYTYTNDNSEVPIFLFRMAEIDTDRASMYRATALKTTDFLLTIQNSNGSWRVVDNDLTQTPLFTAHAVCALSIAYQYCSNQSGYQVAIENALSWIAGNIGADGRVKMCSEINASTESWRPPSSDQSVVIRAYALAERLVSNSTDVSNWKTNRQTLIGWLNQCIDSTGAVKNGLGTTGLNPDVTYITDHVYTTAFAIEAYYQSYLTDNDQTYLDNAKKIVNFASGNLYYSSSSTPQTNGVLRGGYNLQAQNYDTSIVAQDGNSEGGGNMIYSGWCNAPIASLFFELNSYISGWLKLNISGGNSGTGWVKLGNITTTGGSGWIKK